jgi:hypothetical protein
VPADRDEVVMVKAVGVTVAAAMDRVTVAVLLNLRVPAVEVESVTLTPKE